MCITFEVVRHCAQDVREEQTTVIIAPVGQTRKK